MLFRRANALIDELIEPSAELIDLRNRHATAVRHVDAALAAEGAKPAGDRDWAVLHLLLELRNVLAPGDTRVVRAGVPVVPGRS